MLKNLQTLLGIYSSCGLILHTKDKVRIKPLRRLTILLVAFLIPTLGFMSLMMRDAFAKASPGIPFTLEATTSESRDRYRRLGFEVGIT